ncbi:hypothetical protein ACFLT7_03395 [candidate division KSB1 bacterium]
MRKIPFLLLMLLAVMILLAAFSCGKTEETTEPDWSSSLFGRWTGEKESESDGNKILETISVVFYARGTYRWEYTYAVNGVKDDDQSYDEPGDFTATETTIIFTPNDGDARTLTYELTGRSDILFILSDDKGWIWNFDDVWYPSQSK